MKTLLAFVLLAVVARGALIPITDSSSSSVHVKSENSGHDYSYSIQERRQGGVVALEPLPSTVDVIQHHVIPQIKTVKLEEPAPEEGKLKEVPLKLEYISPSLVAYPAPALHYLPLPYYHLIP